MARCARQGCRRWRPDVLVRFSAGLQTEEGWYCSRSCLQTSVEERLEQLVRAGSAPLVPTTRVRLGALLVAGDAKLPPSTLAAALDAQRASGRRLGAELLEMGAVTVSALLHALAKQANTKCLTAIDPAVAAHGHGGLSREMVRALGLVPFAADHERRTLKVAYAAPLPRVALAALRELTDWAAEPYLVSDAVFGLLREAYGPGTAEDRPQHGAAAGSRRDGLNRIAQLAERHYPARISHARLDSHLWVRVQAPGHVDDVLVSVADFEEDGIWQTAPTLH